MDKSKKITKEKLGILITLLTGIVYFLGYIKYFLILKALRINVSVSEIYSIFNIAISGIVLLISMLFTPTICVMIGKQIFRIYKIEYPIKQPKSLSDKISDNFFIYLYPVMVIFAPLMLSIIFLRNFLNGYILKAEMFRIGFGNFVFALDTFFVIFFLVYPKIKMKSKKFIGGCLLFIWCISILYNYNIKLEYAIKNKQTISTINQDTGLIGNIITDITINNDSIKENKNRYLTEGILLNKNKDIYYFAIENDYKTDLYMISESHVLIFIHTDNME